MRPSADGVDGVLGSHGAAPDLGVRQEEQLVVRQVQAGKLRFRTSAFLTSLVRHECLFHASVVGDVLSLSVDAVYLEVKNK